MAKPNYGGKGNVKKIPVATPKTKTTAKMPPPKQAGKLGAGGCKGKQSSCGK
jgi:hypothetical protein